MDSKSPKALPAPIGTKKAKTISHYTPICDTEDLSSPHKAVLLAYRDMLAEYQKVDPAPAVSSGTATATASASSSSDFKKPSGDDAEDHSTFTATASAAIERHTLGEGMSKVHQPIPLRLLMDMFCVVCEEDASKIVIRLQIPMASVTVRLSGHITSNARYPHQAIDACRLVLNALNQVTTTKPYVFEAVPKITMASRKYQLGTRINLMRLAQSNPGGIAYDVNKSPNASMLDGRKSAAEITSNGIVITSAASRQHSIAIFKRVQAAIQPFKLATL